MRKVFIIVFIFVSFITYSAENDVFIGKTWKEHFVNDILPFYTMSDALGKPVGAFPTYRLNNGKVKKRSQNGRDKIRPRMLGRQIYVYSMGYYLTGDTNLLKIAKKGVDFLFDYAEDKENGAFFTEINSDGKGIPGIKNSQDISYVMMGPVAYYLVTRDKEVEKEILKIRDLFFESGSFYNETNGTFTGTVSHSLRRLRNYDDIVYVLDIINAFLIHAQPIMSEEEDRKQFLEDLKILGEILIKDYYLEGNFSRNLNIYSRGNVEYFDYGHTVKSYWTLKLISDRSQEKLFKKTLEGFPKILEKAYDRDNEIWYETVGSKDQVSYNASWWVYSEVDQAAMIFKPDGYKEKLNNTLRTWLDVFVDKKNKEVVSHITSSKKKVRGWGNYSKANEWKNGFHSTEHALMMYILMNKENNKNYSLYYAVPENDFETFIAKPYVFEGDVIKKEKTEDVEIDGEKLIKVKVTFN